MRQLVTGKHKKVPFESTNGTFIILLIYLFTTCKADQYQ